MVHRKVKADFVYELKQAITAMFGENPHDSSDYPAIVSSVAMRRLISYLEKGDIIIGGKYEEDDHYMEPSVIENLPADAPILNEEIFGPIFPLMEFDAIEEVIDYVKQHEKPLALYFFSNNKKHQQRMIRETSSGEMCINDTLIHVATRNFLSEVWNSGMGHYHGKYGFETFTHLKSVVTSSFMLDMKVKYPPYEGKLSRFKRFL
jgi:aldehyde dehydrogenase (NAD+)